MSKITKMALDRAESRLTMKLHAKMREWESKNPKPCEPLDRKTAFKIALGDKAWPANALKRMDAYGDVTCRDQLMQDSPRAAAADRERTKAIDQWKKQHDQFQQKLLDEIELIIDRAAMGTLTAEQLVQQVEAYTK